MERLDPTGWLFERKRIPMYDEAKEAKAWDFLGQRFRFGGFAYAYNSSFGLTDRLAEIPLWTLALVLLVAPSISVYRWSRRHRRRLRGLCMNRGYNLRASQGVCPECGTPIPEETPERRRLTKIVIVSVSAAFVAVDALCWYGGDASARREVAQADRTTQAAEAARAASERIDVQAPADQAAWEREHAAIESKRREIISVDLIRVSDRRSGIRSPAASLWASIGFNLTNRSGKAINTVGGVIELFGPDHRLLGSVGWGLGMSWGPGLSVSGGLVAALDEATRSALAEGKVTADYCATDVRYADGSTQIFAAGLWPGAFCSTTKSSAQ